MKSFGDQQAPRQMSCSCSVVLLFFFLVVASVSLVVMNTDNFCFKENLRSSKKYYH